MDRLHQHRVEDTGPRGGRGLFYDLRPRGIPGNPRGVIYVKEMTDTSRESMEATPEFVTDQLASMRRVYDPTFDEWLIPEEEISDAHAPDPIGPSEVSDASEAADIVKNYLNRLWLTRQAGQPVYLELRCEAADLIPRLVRVARPYGVWVYSGGGSDGLKPKKEAAERAADREVPTIIGHLGDFDEAGGNIYNAFKEDVSAFVDWHCEYQGAQGDLDVDRLALTYQQAVDHDLLDSHGKAELDGLPVPVLDAIVIGFIKKHMDLKILEAVKNDEPQMRKDAIDLL